MITAELLRKILNYDPETGVFTWRVDRGARTKVGHEAGWIARDGYRYIRLDGHAYLAHRLAVLFMTGTFPLKGMETDHANRERSDNRWSNLRVATVSQNRANSRLRTGKSLPKGVRAVPGGRFHARIIHNGKDRHLGSFKTAAEAHRAYQHAAAVLHGEFARAG